MDRHFPTHPLPLLYRSSFQNSTQYAQLWLFRLWSPSRRGWAIDQLQTSDISCCILSAALCATDTVLSCNVDAGLMAITGIALTSRTIFWCTSVCCQHLRLLWTLFQIFILISVMRGNEEDTKFDSWLVTFCLPVIQDLPKPLTISPRLAVAYSAQYNVWADSAVPMTMILAIGWNWFFQEQQFSPLPKSPLFYHILAKQASHYLAYLSEGYLEC